MFIHTNRKEVIQLPMEHIGVPHLQVGPTRHIASPNEVEETKVETNYKKFNSN